VQYVHKFLGTADELNTTELFLTVPDNLNQFGIELGSRLGLGIIGTVSFLMRLFRLLKEFLEYIV